MSRLVVRRTAAAPAVAALIGIPLLAVGFDVALLPRLFPGYLRRVDWIAEQAGISPPPAGDGPVEAWALVFLVVGFLLVGWSLKELVAPRAVLAADESGLELGTVLGLGGSKLVLPWDEVLEAVPATMQEHSEVRPALALRIADPERLPDRPWGARWVDDILFVRAGDWERPVGRVVRRLQAIRDREEVTIEAQEALPLGDRSLAVPAAPAGFVMVDDDHGGVTYESVDYDPTAVDSDPKAARRARLEMWIGGALVVGSLAGAVVARVGDGSDWLGAVPGGFYVIPALCAVFGLWLVGMGYQDWARHR